MHLTTWQRMVATWLAIYPSITILLELLSDPLRGTALPVRTLILTLLLVPFMVLVAVPLASRLVLRLSGVRAPGPR